MKILSVFLEITPNLATRATGTLFELPEWNNVDPSPHGRILLLISLLNSFHREGLQNYKMTSLCFNNIKESIFLKHELVSRTYYKSGPHDTQYCMENPEQAFIDYASLSNNKVGVIILRKKDKVREEKNVKPNATEYNNHEMTTKAEEKVEEESEDEFEEEIKEEEEEEEEHVEYFDSFPSLEELRYHEWLLKYPKPYSVNAKIRTKSFTITEIMSSRLEPRMKPSNPMKIYTTSIIDYDLGVVVFGKPFVEKTRLIYDNNEGMVAFDDNNEKLIFKMPYKIEMFKNVDFMRSVPTGYQRSS
nr:hypothetical protein [Tanacetum cinerariifolium]